MKDPKQICADAAEIIQRDGWYQGDFYPDPQTSWRADETDDEHSDRYLYEDWLADRTAPVCAMGAIRRAVTGGSVMDIMSGATDRQLVRQAADLLAGTIGPSTTALDVPRWNDARERTREDVILAFKQAAAG